MSDFHFIAVLTYGKEKHGDQSDFKLGQGAGMRVLLALFGNRAQEFVTPRASYRYVNLHVKGISAHRNYLVLRVTPDEKAQVETICRQQGSYTWVYLWEQDTRRWLEFPSAPQAHYIDPSSYGGSCPKFPPTHAKFVTPSKLTDDAPESSSAGGLTVTQSGNWWWIAGDTYPHREALRNAGATWSKSRREWYYKGQALPQAIRDLGASADSVSPPVNGPAPAPLPSIVPVSLPPVETKSDNVQDAIERIKNAPKMIALPKNCEVKHGTASVAQEYVGELTGSITGNVHCYGYAVDQGVCVYLNFGGPRTAVEAIRAKFSKGEMITCVPWDGAAVELTPGEDSTGKYRDFMQNIPEARYTSVILLHEQVTAPNYSRKSRTCIMRTDEAQGIAMLKHHVTQLVNVPVFDAWADYLWNAGALASLVSQPLRAGGIDLWSIELDTDAWTRLICGGLEQAIITLPNSDVSATTTPPVTERN